LHQRALIIGGTSGIGLSIAQAMLSAGARVGVIGRNREKLASAVRTLSVQRQDIVGLQADVSDDTQLKTVIADALEALGDIDVLVNSQGVIVIKPGEESDLADYHTIMNTNLKSVYFACTEVGKMMLKRGSGAIINIASLASFRGLQRASLYAMSKHGVLALTKTLATEWAPRGVRVNAVAPGYFMTDITRGSLSPERKDAALRATPMGRFGDLPEIAGAAVFLASPAASFITGETIVVDGGFLAKGL
jgi:NAD(P)-dependent dehydrogenase (short-subunit alcohol dehydrogenase family)